MMLSRRQIWRRVNITSSSPESNKSSPKKGITSTRFYEDMQPTKNHIKPKKKVSFCSSARVRLVPTMVELGLSKDILFWSEMDMCSFKKESDNEVRLFVQLAGGSVSNYEAIQLLYQPQFFKTDCKFPSIKNCYFNKNCLRMSTDRQDLLPSASSSSSFTSETSRSLNSSSSLDEDNDTCKGTGEIFLELNPVFTVSEAQDYTLKEKFDGSVYKVSSRVFF